MISGPGSHWTVTNELVVGNEGNGTLRIQNGGKVASAEGLLGRNTEDGIGTVIVTGDNSQLSVTNGLYLGGSSSSASGAGNLSITGGGSVNVGATLKLWNNGTLTIDGGNVTARSFDRSVGTFVHNDGTLTISGGTYTHAPALGVLSAANIFALNGGTSNAVPTFQLTNGATTDEVEALVIGTTGRGQFLIGGGSTVAQNAEPTILGSVEGVGIRGGQGVIGLNAGSTGTVAVSGANSRWSTAWSQVVGYSGNGHLDVAAGGSADGGSSEVGLVAGATGTVTVSGAGSRWTLTNALYLGKSGLGTLNVTAGGVVRSNVAYVGYNTSATGSATVSGAISVWTITNGLYVGGNELSAGGAGSLTVTGGGAVNVGGLTKVWQSGTLHVGNGGTLNTGTLSVVSGGSFVVDAGGSFSGAVQSVGNQTLNGNLTGNVTVQSGGTLNGAGKLTGDLDVQSGGQLGGTAVITGVVSGAGTVSPGNSPGVLDAAQVDPTSGMDFLFQFTAANTIPDYLNRTASLNDVLHLTHATTPFLSALTSNNVITVDFQVASLNNGDYFLGGFFTNQQATDFYGDGTVDNAIYNYLLNGSALNLSQWQVGVSTIAQPNTDFGSEYGGVVNGRVMQFTLTAVPEPGSLALVAAAAAGAYLRRRKPFRS